MNIQRGDVWYVNLEPTIGSEMKKMRPAVVISSNIINANAAVVIVCPITDAVGKTSPIHIPIAKGESGLKKDSIAHCGQIRAVDRIRLAKKIGTLNTQRMGEISVGLILAMDLSDFNF